MKTNVDYQVVATFISESESAEGILEALQILKDWNPNWNPRVFMTDYSNEEMNAIEAVFGMYFMRSSVHVIRNVLAPQNINDPPPLPVIMSYHFLKNIMK